LLALGDEGRELHVAVEGDDAAQLFKMMLQYMYTGTYPLPSGTYHECVHI
jgi:hypothetical protein